MHDKNKQQFRVSQYNIDYYYIIILLLLYIMIDYEVFV